MMEDICELKDRDPETAARCAMAIGAALYLICDWGRIDASEDDQEWLNHVEFLLWEADTILALTYFPERCMLHRDAAEAFHAYEIACAWLGEHEVPEQWWVLDSVLILAVTFRPGDDAEWLCLLYDFCYAFGLDQPEAAEMIAAARQGVVPPDSG